MRKTTSTFEQASDLGLTLRSKQSDSLTMRKVKRIGPGWLTERIVGNTRVASLDFSRPALDFSSQTLEPPLERSPTLHGAL